MLLLWVASFLVHSFSWKRRAGRQLICLGLFYETEYTAEITRFWSPLWLKILRFSASTVWQANFSINAQLIYIILIRDHFRSMVYHTKKETFNSVHNLLKNRATYILSYYKSLFEKHIQTTITNWNCKIILHYLSLPLIWPSLIKSGKKYLLFFSYCLFYNWHLT